MAATRRAYTGGAQSTTTASAIASSGTTSFTITAYTGWPYGSDPFFIVVEPGTASEEKILVTRTGSTDTTINIASDSERGQDGTSAVAHSSGSTVFPVFTSVDADEANAVASIITADVTNTRIGINDSTPSYTLDVTGDINATGDIRIGGDPIPGGHLAIDESSGDTTISATEQIVHTISFTLSASRRVYLLGYLPRVDNASTSLQAVGYISTSASPVTSVYQMQYQYLTTSGVAPIYVHRDVGLAAGSYTFYLWSGTNTGTARINNASGFRRSGLVAFDMGAN